MARTLSAHQRGRELIGIVFYDQSNVLTLYRAVLHLPGWRRTSQKGPSSRQCFRKDPATFPQSKTSCVAHCC